MVKIFPARIAPCVLFVMLYSKEESPMEESGSVIYETLVSPTDLTPVLEALEVMQQSLDQVNVGLEQLHADVSLTFLAVVLLIGVILGCAISFMLVKIWRP